MDIRETGQKIVKLRHNNKITQEELAEKIGVSSQTVSKWENGKNMPDIEHLMDIAKLFNVPYSFFIEDENDEHLEYRSRLFNEDNMYTKVKTFAQFEGLEQTLKSLEFMRAKHNGQYRRQSKYSGDNEKVKYINHPLMMACHAHAMGIKDDDILSAILLHDVVEETDTAINELPVNEETKEIVNLLTFKLLPNMSKEESKKIYYQNIAKNKKAVTVKILDRCNNISTMAYVFSKEKIIEYINETEEYIIPLISVLKSEPAPYCNIAFVVKYHIISVLEAIKPLL